MDEKEKNMEKSFWLKCHCVTSATLQEELWRFYVDGHFSALEMVEWLIDGGRYCSIVAMNGDTGEFITSWERED